MRRRNRPFRHFESEVHYQCDSCGEEIVIPVDVSAGRIQQFVEDCPVCCRPNVIEIELEEHGESHARSHREF